MYYTRCQKHLDQARKNNRTYKDRHFVKNESLYLRPIDLTDLVNGPVIPAKKKISVTLNIRSFKKGKPLSYEMEWAFKPKGKKVD